MGWLPNPSGNLIVLRLVLSLGPLLLTPVLFYLLAEGHLNLGGGEKDILLLIPWIAWSLIYAVSFWVCWRKGYPPGRSAWRSALVGLVGLGVLGLALFLVGELGILGRF